MNKKRISKLKQRMALLLVAVFLTQPATAFAVESGDMARGRLEGDAETASGDSAEALSENDAEAVSKNSAEALSENNTEAASENTASEVSDSNEEAVSEDNAGSVSVSAVSGNTEEEAAVGLVSEHIAWLCVRLNRILSEKSVRAVVFDCDEYALKTGAGSAAGTVCTVPCATTVELKSVSFNDGEFWFEVRVCTEEADERGYIDKSKLICIDEDYTAWESEISSNNELNRIYSGGQTTQSQALKSVEDFPESYRDKLYALNASHPNWVFVPQKMGSLTLAAVVDGEYADKNRNWIASSAKDSFKDSPAPQSGWYYASKSAISYYMNPVNFFDESHIFQFEQLAYNSTYHTQDGVQSILNGTFMAGKIPDDSLTYAEAFMKIGKSRGLSPYHLSSRVRLEQGVNGTSQLISGTYPGYEGYYNYFNIKASGQNMVENGLKYAKEQGWNTRYKSLDGGSAFLGNNYISQGQDTLYLEKFDLVGTLYTHQYMQNVMAPSTEAVTTCNQYKNAGTLNNAFVFKIPVFSDAGSGGGSGEAKDKVNDVKPSVSFKLIKKANLFYLEDAEESFACYRVNSNVDIFENGIKTSDKTAANAGSSPYFEVLSYKDNILTLKTKNRTKDNTANTYKKIFLSVSSDAGDFEGALNVSTVSSKPAFKAAGAVIYDGFESGTVILTDNNGGSVKLPSDIRVSTKDTGITVSINSEDGYISVKPEASFKAGTKKFVLESTEWSGAVTVKADVKKGGIPALKLSKKTVTLNSNVPMEKYGTTDVKVYINGNGMKPDGVGIAAADAKTENAFGNGLSAVFDKEKSVISLGVREGSALKGTYSLLLSGTVKDGSGSQKDIKGVKLTVKVTDKAPEKAFSLKKSGKINLVDRADSCILVTAAFSNTGAERITGIKPDDSSRFETALLKRGDITPDGKLIKTDAGTVVIKAKEGAALNRGESYNLSIGFELNNGLNIKKNVTVIPKQTNAKLYGNIVTAAMTRSSSTSRNYVIRSKGLTKDDSVIEKVETDFGSLDQYFSYKPDSGQGKKRYWSGLFEIKNKEIKNGTYSLKFKVYLKGRGENTGPVKVTLKVRIR